MNIIEKDILTVTKGVIAHQVNCKGVMGAGLAKKIADKWPMVKEEYLELCSNPPSPQLFLGWQQLIKVETGLYVSSVFGQFGYGRDRCHTNYLALIKGLKKAKDNAGKMMASPLPLYVPYGIGCGLAGGNWHVVRELIEQELPDAIICKPPLR